MQMLKQWKSAYQEMEALYHYIPMVNFPNRFPYSFNPFALLNEEIEFQMLKVDVRIQIHPTVCVIV